MPVDLSVARLDELTSAGRSQFGYRGYPEYGHEVIVFDFSKLSLSPGFREAVNWIKQTVGGALQQALQPPVAGNVVSASG